MTETTNNASETSGATRTPTWIWVTIGVLVVAVAVLITLNVALAAEDEPDDVTVDIAKMNEEINETNGLLMDTNALMEEAVSGGDGGDSGG
jgi:hypothetical protein